MSCTENTGESGRQSNGRFTRGNPGRPKGAKNKLQEAFWTDFASAWEAHGLVALEKVATEDPATFVKIAARVIPKDVGVDEETHYVMWLPKPCATAEEWAAKYSPKPADH